MLGKFCFLILSVGVIASLLLTLRQQRLDAVHELVVIQQRIFQEDQNILPQVRARIAASLTPDRIDRLAVAIGRMTPIGVDRLEPTIPGVDAPGSTRIAAKTTTGANKHTTPANAPKRVVLSGDNDRTAPPR